MVSMLGIVEFTGVNVNLSLIVRGHSYFEMCYQLPQDFILYALSESEAFEAESGIRISSESRRFYLEWLTGEGKTVFSPTHSSCQRCEMPEGSRCYATGDASFRSGS